eukprot:5852880-Pyramimonas_sp.AAC.2
MLSQRQKITLLTEEAFNQIENITDVFFTVEHLQGRQARGLSQLFKIVKGELIVRLPLGLKQQLIKVYIFTGNLASSKDPDKTCSSPHRQYRTMYERRWTETLDRTSLDHTTFI